MPFTLERTAIPDVVRIRSQRFPDPRGSFLETFRASSFAELGIEVEVAQVNESRSAAGVVRGLHYQLEPHALGKLVRVLRGAVLDVALDLRRGSPTYGRHVTLELHAERGDLAWIPRGFAHGFCALEDDTHFLYLQTGEYYPEAEAGIDALDPTLAIAWPFEEARLTRSQRDRDLPAFDDADHDFHYPEPRAADSPLRF